jgi:hypothetical protein
LIHFIYLPEEKQVSLQGQENSMQESPQSRVVVEGPRRQSTRRGESQRWIKKIVASAALAVVNLTYKTVAVGQIL